MSLTLGSGPLGRGAGAANYTFDAPAHKLLFEPYGPRLRAVVDGRTIFDSTGARLLHETGIAPVAYVPLEDFDAALLQHTGTTTHCPFKGDASYRSIVLGDRAIVDAVWAYEDPIETATWLRGFAALDRRRVDHFLIEDEPVAALRDPYHRCDAHPSDRTVEIRAAASGAVLARSRTPVLLFETSAPIRAYLQWADVPGGLLEPSDTRTHCPYKGEAEHFGVHLPGGGTAQDAAWVHPHPTGESAAIEGLVGFGGEGIEVVIA